MKSFRKKEISKSKVQIPKFSSNDVLPNRHYKVLPSDNVKTAGGNTRRDSLTSETQKCSINILPDSKKLACPEKLVQESNHAERLIQNPMGKESDRLLSARNEILGQSGQRRILSLSIDMVRKITRTSSDNQLLKEKKKNSRVGKMVRSKSFYGVDENLSGRQTRPIEAWLQQDSIDKEEEEACRRCQYRVLNKITLPNKANSRKTTKADLLTERTNNSSSKSLETKNNIPVHQDQRSKQNKYKKLSKTKAVPYEPFNNDDITTDISYRQKQSRESTAMTINTKEPLHSELKTNNKADCSDINNDKMAPALSVENDYDSKEQKLNEIPNCESSTTVENSVLDNCSEFRSSIVRNSALNNGSENQIYTFNNPKLEPKNQISLMDHNSVIRDKASKSHLAPVHKHKRMKNVCTDDPNSRPKYSGYKPKNGICFVSFKSMFSKPLQKQSSSEEQEDHGFYEPDVSKLENTPNPTLSEEPGKFDHYFDVERENRYHSKDFTQSEWPEETPICVNTSYPRFSNKEQEIIDRTRKELKERISSAQKPKLGLISQEKKIQLNIFLQDKVNKYKSPSLETNTSTEDEAYCGSEEHELTTRQKCSTDILTESKITRQPVSNKEISSSDINENKNSSVQFYLSDLDKEKDDSEEKRVYYSCGDVKYEPVKLLPESCPSKSKLSETKPTLLQAIIHDSNQKVIKKRSKLKRNKFDINIQTEYGIQNGIPDARSTPKASPFMTPFLPRSNLVNTESPQINSNNSEKKVSDESNDSKPTNRKGSAKIDVNQSENDMQAFKRKLQESLELYRRLHFCEVQVSKETVIRALMTPSQIRIYQALHPTP